jgi:hypothetical protein
MSGFGQYNMLNYAKLGDLKNAKIMPNPETGRLYLAQVDPETGTISSDNDVYSPSALLNPANLVDLKVDVDDGVTKFLKRVAEFGEVTDLGGGKIKVSEDARNNPAYKKALDAQINALTVTPRSTTSVLYDYVGDYQFFNSEAEKKELIAKGAKEEKLIKVERKNGVYEPVPDAKQEEVAKEYLRNQIEIGVGQKETQTQGFSPKAPRSGGSGTKPTEGAKGRESALNTAISYAEKLQKNPKDGFVINKIKDAYRSLGPVEVVTLMDPNTKEIYGYDIFKVKNGKIVKIPVSEGGAPSGAYIRKGGAVQGLFEALNKDQKRGEEAIDWGTAVGEYKGEKSRLSERLPLAQKQPLYVDMKVLRANNQGKTDAQIKAAVMQQNNGKNKIIWQN